MNTEEQKVFDRLRGSQKNEAEKKIKDGFSIYSFSHSSDAVTVRKGYTYYVIEVNGTTHQI